MRKKENYSKRPFVLTVITILLIGGVILLAILKGKIGINPSAEIPAVSPSISPGITVQWATYRTVDNKLEVGYPKSLSGCKINLDLEELNPVRKTARLLEVYCSSGTRLVQIVYEKSQTDELSWWFGLDKENKEVFDKYGNKSTTQIAGKTATGITYTQASGNIHSFQQEFLVNFEGYNYLILFPEYNCTGEDCKFRDIERQIASTIKFPTFEPTKASSLYKCPENGWVDCMPGIGKNNELNCSKEAETWYKANCPNFEGLAY